MIGMIDIGGAAFLLLFLLAIPISLAMFAFWLWMLIHAAQNKGLNDGEKVAWVIIIALVHFLGALIYFFVGRPKARLGSSSATSV